MNKIVLITILIVTSYAWSNSVKRIKSIAFNKAKVEKIFIAQGMSTLVTFNCDINEMVSGNDQQITLKGLMTNKKQMIITLAQDAAQATNIFVKCGQKIDPYIFDVVPSKVNHQDYLKINVSYGEPEEEKDTNETLNKMPKKRKAVSIEVQIPEPKPETPLEKLKNKNRTIEVEQPREKLDDLIKNQPKTIEVEKPTVKELEIKPEEPTK